MNAPELGHGGGARFWLAAALGWAGIGWGLLGLWRHRVDTRPANLANFVLGGALLHDLIVAPVVIVAGVVIARAVPARARAVAQATLIVSAFVALFAYPLVRDYARVLHNPTSLPHNYAANLAVVVGVVCGVAVLAALAKVGWKPMSGIVDGHAWRRARLGHLQVALDAEPDEATRAAIAAELAALKARTGWSHRLSRCFRVRRGAPPDL